MDETIDPKAYCCKVECGADAEWQIVYGSAPDAYTHACTDHVGELLEAGVENTVLPLGMR